MSARILIVEDEEPLTLILRYNLESEGYAVDSSGRGDEAELRLKEQPPDLAVIDWMLPGLSGIELIRRLRAKPETRRLPIIMLTARGEEGERVRGLATGADDYIVKPFSVPELLARIRALLRRAKPERVAALLSAGLIAVAPTEDAPLDDVVAAAVHALIGGSGSLLASAQYDDLVGEAVSTNLPGTDRERPNWRLKVGPDVLLAFAARRAHAVLAALAKGRR